MFRTSSLLFQYSGKNSLQSMLPSSVCTNIMTFFKSTHEPKKLNKTELIDAIRDGIVQYINLSRQSIDDDFFLEISDAILQPKARVTHLYLSGNQITDIGIEKGISLFQTKSTLNSIDLSDNKIGIKGASLILDTLRENFSITNLNLFGNPTINDSLVEVRIPKYIKRNQQIKKEKEKLDYYIACAAVGSSVGLPDPLIDIIFEYSNEASLLDAREFVKNTIYKNATEEVKKINISKLR
ncbi:MAG TPA: hypothetical protein PLV31_03595 [Gammaproteobacteria bacterium]|nr:hypothetical protein [Gammaproteobacteria bacterium]